MRQWPARDCSSGRSTSDVFRALAPRVSASPAANPGQPVLLLPLGTGNDLAHVAGTGTVLNKRAAPRRAGYSPSAACESFRTAPRFETAEPSLKWIETSLFVGKAFRAPDRVVIGFHEVL